MFGNSGRHFFGPNMYGRDRTSPKCLLRSPFDAENDGIVVGGRKGHPRINRFRTPGEGRREGTGSGVSGSAFSRLAAGAHHIPQIYVVGWLRDWPLGLALLARSCAIPNIVAVLRIVSPYPSTPTPFDSSNNIYASINHAISEAGGEKPAPSTTPQVSKPRYPFSTEHH